ncbi:Phosphatidylserine decarboxylase [Carabus blaptoides fortunei]
MALRLIRTAQFFHRPVNIIGLRQCNFKQNKVSVVHLYTGRYYCTKAETKTGWNSWRSVAVRFVPVGLCLIAVMQWRAYRKITSTRTAKQWEVDFYCSLPLRAISRCWGWIADKQMPVMLRPWLYGLYASTFGVNLLEAESSDLKDYPSLADFFARGLKEGVRSIDSESCLISPCDGKVLQCGPVNSCYVEQVKGVTYSLEKFLGDNTWQVSNENCADFRMSLLQKPEGKPTTLYQCILYLAPGDYHRFHSPADWEPTYRRHFSGELLSVSPTYAKWIPGLFCLNERAVYLGSWKHGFFSYTAVGATNVGSVKVYFDNNLQTNLKDKYNCNDALLPANIKLHKGDPVGEFRMGSTIVLLFEAPPNFEFNLVPGQKVRMGEGIGCVRKMKYVDKVEKPNYNNVTNAS